MVEAVVNHVGYNNKVDAIKEMSLRYGLELKEAKKLVETVILTEREYKRTITIVKVLTDYVQALSVEEAKDRKIPSWILGIGGEATVTDAYETGF